MGALGERAQGSASSIRAPAVPRRLPRRQAERVVQVLHVHHVVTVVIGVKSHLAHFWRVDAHEHLKGTASAAAALVWKQCARLRSVPEF